MEEGNGNSDVPEQPRQPRNLQDVLRYAVEAKTIADPNPTPEPDLGPLAPERRRFLEEAISSLTVDVCKLLMEALETLKGLDKDSLSPETYENSLDVIADYVDNLDAANDFVKLGGFEVVKNCLQSQHPGIRWRIADIVAQCTQNNPFSQNHAVNLKLLEPLIQTVDKDPDDQCKTKAFFAISNIVRDSPIGLKEFMRLNGFSAVKKAMSSDSERLRSKAAFFFSSVVSHHPNVIWDVVSMGFTELLISRLQQPIEPSHEFVASSLLLLVEQSKEAEAACKSTDLTKATLKKLVDDYSADEAYTELVDSANKILTLLK